jgi:hypothetical protein
VPHQSASQMTRYYKPESNSDGAYNLYNGRLTLRTSSALVAQEALQAKAAGWNFTVRVGREPVRYFTGRVNNVVFDEREIPPCWQIVMREDGDHPREWAE